MRILSFNCEELIFVDNGKDDKIFYPFVPILVT